MGFLEHLKSNSSTFYLRSKEEIDQLFSEMANSKLPIDNNLDFKIRMSLQKVKLQLYYELKLTEYRRTVNSSKELSSKKVVDSTLGKPKKNKKDKSKKNSKKVDKQGDVSARPKILPKYAIITIISNSDVDSIVSFFKENPKELNQITDYWIRLNIIRGKILNYYKNSMSKFFPNYQKISEGLKEIGLSRLAVRRRKIIEDFHIKLDEFKIKETTVDGTIPPVEKGKKKSSFEYLKEKEWILDWNCVMFKRGSVVIYSRSELNVKFKPTNINVRDSLESFNYLKKYLNERLPPVRCLIKAEKLTLIDEINFNSAIQQFSAAARQRLIKSSGKGGYQLGGPTPMSFSQAMSKARQLSPEEFKKYKSEYIDFLVSHQSKEYKVIPSVERLAHTNSDITEYAFMFSIECKSGDILIVYENVNPDRSTLLFIVKRESYDQCIRAIYNFLQSAEINKRSSLRDRELDIGVSGIERYRSINHDLLYTWKRVINNYRQYYRNGYVFMY